MPQHERVAQPLACVVARALDPRARMPVERRETVADTRVGMDASARSALAAELFDGSRPR